MLNRARADSLVSGVICVFAPPIYWTHRGFEDRTNLRISLEQIGHLTLPNGRARPHPQ